MKDGKLDISDWQDVTKTYRVEVEPIPKMKKGELEEVIEKSRCKMEHADWHAAREDVKTLSETGGIRSAALITIKTKVVVSERWSNGRMVENFGKRVNYVTKKEAKKL